MSDTGEKAAATHQREEETCCNSNPKQQQHEPTWWFGTNPTDTTNNVSVRLWCSDWTIPRYEYSYYLLLFSQFSFFSRCSIIRLWCLLSAKNGARRSSGGGFVSKHSRSLLVVWYLFHSPATNQEDWNEHSVRRNDARHVSQKSLPAEYRVLVDMIGGEKNIFPVKMNFIHHRLLGKKVFGRATFNKLWLFSLVAFDKLIIILDQDILIRQNITHWLDDYPAPASCDSGEQ